MQEKRNKRERFCKCLSSFILINVKSFLKLKNYKRITHSYMVLVNVTHCRQFLIYLLIADCSPGYVGSDCTEQCRHPNYGTDCQGLCNCSKEFCDIATGCFSPKGILFALLFFVMFVCCPFFLIFEGGREGSFTCIS